MADERLFNEFPEVSTEAWEAAIEKDLKGADYNKKLIWKTNEGFDVKPYYRANDIEDLEYLKSNPDEKPFVRGYNKQANEWDIRQDVDTCDLQEQNTICLEALDRGANSIGVNAEKVETEADLDVLFKGIEVQMIKVNFVKAKNFLKLLKLYVSFVAKRGLDAKKLEGSISFDPFFCALKHGKFCAPYNELMDELAETIRYAMENLPLFDVVAVNGKMFRDAGSSITQELGFSLAAANEYMAEMTDRGLSADEIGERMMFYFATGGNYFFEIAKIRAARLLWCKISEQYQGATEKAARVHLHSENTQYNKTVFDAHVNLLRTTTETMSAAVAGADSISVTPFDIALRKSDEFSRRIALNQQILLKEESYLDKIVDPSAGSYYIETLTNNIAEQSWKLFQEVEKLGGFAKAIKEGFVQDQIAETDAKVAKDLARRKQVIVGTNQYPNLAETEINVEECKCCCKADENPDFKVLPFRREAKPFEDLRLSVMRAAKKPSVFMLGYGNLAMRNARSGFSTNFFGTAGYQMKTQNFDNAAEGAEQALKENPDILVLCSSDDEYMEMAKQVLPVVKGKIKHIIVAGGLAEDVTAELNAMGVTDYIHVRVNVLETLQRYTADLVK
ncbi:MAG: methylmalonyl-CoA mutase small subunit [Bacteroidales bacterium]|nr:methylmalonyl-CoA mutase small subunit [Candidatus Scybalousia scybalohippi]